MSLEQSFFFYDLETSGLRAREDRIMQFAGMRTTLELEPVGEPVNILVKMTDDALPSPGAIQVTKITPQATLMDGVLEAEFCRTVTQEVFTPGTIAVGYNTVRFDDEFMRAILWRNFYDPYEWEWKEGRGRWDILDVVRMVRALRPEGIRWPFREDGAPTNRLELITKLNGVTHEHAHDALSDVYATIAVAKLIREKQPEMLNYLLKMRDKNEIRKLVNLDQKKPFVYASGRYANEHNKTTVAFPIAPSRNGNVLVFDLRYNVEELLVGGPKHSDSRETFDEALTAREPYSADEPISKIPFPIVKELCYNKCPVVAPIGVLEKEDGWAKIGLEREKVEGNLKALLNHPEFAEQMRTLNEARPDFPPASEPEGAIYDGFLNDSDHVKVAAVRAASATEDAGGMRIDPAVKLADFHPEFDDGRLPELLLHYKGRNFPKALSEAEAEKYEKYRLARLEKQLPKFMEELNKLEDDYLKEELMLYCQSLSSGY